MATFGTIGIDEPGTIDLRAATVRIDRGGVNHEQEIVVIGEGESSLAIARVHDGVPDSTMFGVVVRQVGHSTTVQVSSVAGVVSVSPVSTASVRVAQSTAADLQATVGQASTVWAVQLSNYSTTAQVSSVAGRVEVGEYSSAAPAANSTGLIVRIASPSTGPFQMSSLGGVVNVQQNSTVWAVQVDGRVRAQNSTIGDLLASVQQNSTVWAVQVDGRVRAQNSTIGDLLASVQQNSTVWFTQAVVRDSSGTGLAASTIPPSSGSQGLHVRQVLQGLNSTCFSTMGNNSTSSTVVSSAAGVRHCVFAYSITSTVQTVNTLSFASSLATPIWQMQMQSISSGISGANLAVSPPSYLFATEAASPLVFKIGPSTGTYHLSFSYFTQV